MSLKISKMSPGELLRLRLSSQNARHAMAKIGVARIRSEGLTKEKVNELSAKSPRGFYSWVIGYGAETVKSTLQEFQGPTSDQLKEEFEKIFQADNELFGGFNNVSNHDILNLQLQVYPELGSFEDMGKLFPKQYERTNEVWTLLKNNMETPSDKPSPIKLLEDHPGWATETPDIRNIRNFSLNMPSTIKEAKEKSEEIISLVNKKYGLGTMEKIENIVVCGIGANDMYLKDLPMLVNADPFSIRKLYSVFEPGQLDNLPLTVKADNTLFIAISRGGGTQETIKCLYFAKKQGLLKHLVGFANKGLLKEFVERENGILQGLNPNIGGRYMWAKGLIVLVPFALSAGNGAWEEYTDAMIKFNKTFWPIGKDETIFNLARHLYLYSSAYNIPGLFVSSNHPVLEAGLRQIFQLHNEAVGKINNNMIAFGAGMEMLPFAHAGADGILGAAISAQLYGAFIFDTSYHYDPKKDIALTMEDLLPSEARHAGLTKELLRMACVFPNQAKFTYAGGPNFMISMDGVSYRNLATLTAFYQNLMYPYLIMNGTNPDSNPNVAMVRNTTASLITALINNKDEYVTPIHVIDEEIPRIMKG